MKYILLTATAIVLLASAACGQTKQNQIKAGPAEIDSVQKTINDPMKYNKLTEFEEMVILKKGTERPWTGEYVDHKEKGVYVCKRCNAPLYSSDDKFDGH